ncbi:hypothetical protein NIES593_16385 [Hydrococcus rivularis NIES-593]|uniref:Uncharacterized protein n=1 Tax=Hydrococcus rivularis NIES-593 TaxID=1921803 RepID=A0A1U7HCC9_9CYAN|nr:hypothetical protein NIES593_16385 [Hydrococcus rivularis NIES-593]
MLPFFSREFTWRFLSDNRDRARLDLPAEIYRKKIKILIITDKIVPLKNGTGRNRTGDLALQIGVSFLTLRTIPSP